MCPAYTGVNPGTKEGYGISEAVLKIKKSESLSNWFEITQFKVKFINKLGFSAFSVISLSNSWFLCEVSYFTARLRNQYHFLGLWSAFIHSSKDTSSLSSPGKMVDMMKAYAKRRRCVQGMLS